MKARHRMTERTYRIQRASEFSGVSVELIRAWERRYGVLKPMRTPSGYRVYTDADIAVLRRLKQLTEQGVSIAEAARLVANMREESETAAAELSAEPSVPATQSEKWRAGLVRAGAELNQAAVHRIIDEAFAALSPLRVFDEIVVPVLQQIGDAWHAGEITVAQEHLVSQAIRARLLTLVQTSLGPERRHALCACFPDDQHEIGLLGAALRLRAAGYRITYLGQRTPATELARAARRIVPDVIALSAIQDEGAIAFGQTVKELAEALPNGLRVLVGGRAAITHQAACREAGMTVVSKPDDWAAALE